MFVVAAVLLLGCAWAQELALPPCELMCGQVWRDDEGNSFTIAEPWRGDYVSWPMMVHAVKYDTFSFHSVTQTNETCGWFHIESLCSHPDGGIGDLYEDCGIGEYEVEWSHDCMEATFYATHDDCPGRSSWCGKHWHMDPLSCCQPGVGEPETEINFLFDGMIPDRGCPACPCATTS